MASSERRSLSRLPADELIATLWLGYRQGRIKATALEFNRHGMAVRTEHPLPAHGTVELALECRSIRIQHVVAVIHNCRSLLDGGYRCGLQFRTDARTQFDREKIRSGLSLLEEMLSVSAVESAGDAGVGVT
jgi:hypothetical protein